jgi:hypothetical protein
MLGSARLTAVRGLAWAGRRPCRRAHRLDQRRCAKCPRCSLVRRLRPCTLGSKGAAARLKIPCARQARVASRAKCARSVRRALTFDLAPACRARRLGSLRKIGIRCTGSAPAQVALRSRRTGTGDRSLDTGCGAEPDLRELTLRQDVPVSCLAPGGRPKACESAVCGRYARGRGRRARGPPRGATCCGLPDHGRRPLPR